MNAMIAVRSSNKKFQKKKSRKGEHTRNESGKSESDNK